MRRGERIGFTLVELLVVIAIISILAGLLLPALEKSIGQARQLDCANRQRQVAMAFLEYAEEYDSCFPPSYAPSWPVDKYWHRGRLYPYLGLSEQLDAEYLDPGMILYCPAVRPFFYGRRTHVGPSSYISTASYLGGFPTFLHDIRNPSRTILLGDLKVTQDDVLHSAYVIDYWNRLVNRHNDRGVYVFLDMHTEAINMYDFETTATGTTIYDTRFRWIDQ